jgi:hypothetical protein
MYSLPHFAFRIAYTQSGDIKKKLIFQTRQIIYKKKTLIYLNVYLT